MGTFIHFRGSIHSIDTMGIKRGHSLERWDSIYFKTQLYHSKDTSFYHGDTYSTMFITTLFIIARIENNLDIHQWVNG